MPKKFSTHAPLDYVCPFCRIARGVVDSGGRSLEDEGDLVYQDRIVSGFIGSQQYPNNKGHVIVIPNEHYENIFDLPPLLAQELHRVSQILATAMKNEYRCEGITTRQHNEPAGGQHVWHFHTHIFPRFPDDGFTKLDRSPMDPKIRAEFAARLKNQLELMNQKSI